MRRWMAGVFPLTAMLAVGCGMAEGKRPSEAEIETESVGTHEDRGQSPRHELGLGAVSAGGSSMRSHKYVLVSTTGQSTPAGEGVCRSDSYVHLPGMGGEAR